MVNLRKDIFISYKNDGEGRYFAKGLSGLLKSIGYEVYYNLDEQHSGKFPDRLRNAVEGCKDFLLVLTASCLEQLMRHDKIDWVREELLTAYENSKNIIPLLIPGVTMPKDKSKMPEDLQFLLDINFIPLYEGKYGWEASVKSIVEWLFAKANKAVTSYEGDKPFIFISYSHEDSNTVSQVITELQKRGYRIWYDEGIDPGTEWDKNIAEHVENCGYFIAFISKNYISSSNCKDELNFARDLEKKRFLVYIEDVDLPSEMKMRLSRIQNIHKYKYNNNEDFYAKLFCADGLDEFKNPEWPLANTGAFEKQNLTRPETIMPTNSSQDKNEMNFDTDWLFLDDNESVNENDDWVKTRYSNPGKKLKATVCAATHKGKVYEKNEDNYSLNGRTTTSGFLSKEHAYSQEMVEPFHLAVSDGEGEKNSGDFASRITIEAIVANSTDLYNTRTSFGNCIYEANERIVQETRNTGRQMESSFAVIGAKDGMVYGMNIGDTSLYHYLNGTLKLINSEWLFEKKPSCIGKAEEYDAFNPTYNVFKINDKDVFLLCSKGLTNMVNDEEICKILASCDSAEDTTIKLVRAALEKGGKDNITVIVAFVEAEESLDNKHIEQNF